MKQIGWGLNAEKGLQRAAGSPVDLAAIKEEVVKGESQLWEIKSSLASGYVVTRVEEITRGGPLEMVIVLGEGAGAKEVIPELMTMARNYGIETIRTHIKRPGLKRIYERLGWKQSEIVMRFNCGK